MPISAPTGSLRLLPEPRRARLPGFRSDAAHMPHRKGIFAARRVLAGLLFSTLLTGPVMAQHAAHHPEHPATQPPVQHPVPNTAAAHHEAHADAPGAVHPFRLGNLEAWSLKDSDIALPLGATRTPWNDPSIPAILTSAGLAPDAIPLSNQPLLLRGEGRVVLIDTGAGSSPGAPGGLQTALAAAGVCADDVTDVLITDYLDRHLLGLLTPEGGLAFPNAQVHIPEEDWEAMLPYPGDAALVAAVTPNVAPFKPGAVITPNITAVPLAGHTESHTGYEIVSGSDRLLYVGDALHTPLISVAHPEWTNTWDRDEAAGVATRQALLARAARENLRLFSGHFPWPGVGRVETSGAGYVWRPER